MKVRGIAIFAPALMESSPKKFIDVRRLFREKNPSLYRFIPGFIFNRLRKIIHEDEVNAFIDSHGHHHDLEFVNDIVRYFELKITCEGLENIPPTEGAILVSNHPLGGLDAMALMYSLQTKRTDMKFLVNDILMSLENLRGLWLAVNKLGKNTAADLLAIDKAYASDQLVMLFPAGMVSRKLDDGIRDLDWKKSFITKARQHQKMVIPIHISGCNRNFFYSLSRWRMRLGIKANIEMLFLVDEMYRQRGHSIHITIGKPVPCEHFDRAYSDSHWAQVIRKLVYQIPENKNAIPSSL